MTTRALANEILEILKGKHGDPNTKLARCGDVVKRELARLDAEDAERVKKTRPAKDAEKPS